MDIKPPKKRHIKNVPDMQRQRRQPHAPKPKPIPGDVNNPEGLRSKVGNALSNAVPKPSLLDIKDTLVGNQPNFKQLVLSNKLSIVYTVIIFLIAFFLYLYRLGSWPKPTALEDVVTLNVQSFTDLSSNIVFGPQKFLDYLLLKLNLAPTLGLRLVSILFTVTALLAFYLLIKRWLSVRIALLATLLFATSTWTLTQTRDAGFINSFFLVMPALLLAGVYIKRQSSSIWIFPLVFLMAVLTYLPGFIWFLLFAIVVYFKNFVKLIKQSSTARNLSLLAVYFLPIIPLAVFLAINTAIIKLWLGLPAGFVLSSQTLLNNAIELPGKLFMSGIDEPTLWLFGSPIFDAATGVLAVTGLVYVAKDNLHPLRAITLAGLLLLSLGLLIIGGSVYISLIVPLIYIFAAFGIFYLLEQWMVIFPRNPFARSIGYVLMTGLVLSISFYHDSRYFIVWPRNDRVIQAFDSVSSDTIDTRSNNNFYIK